MIRIFKDRQEQSLAAAEIFVQAAKKAIEENGKFVVTLTGGTSPEGLHKLLANSPFKEQVDWKKVIVFWGDERWVPLDDDRSNAKMGFETLLNHVPVPADHIFPMAQVSYKPEEYAVEYEKLLKQHLGEGGSFDLMMLGMGDDGHTASLFPGMEVLKEETKWVDAYYLEAQDMYRITLTAPLINKAKKIAVLVYGEKKADALHEVLEGERNSAKYPAQLIQPLTGDVTWLVDQDAAQKLTAS